MFNLTDLSIIDSFPSKSLFNAFRSIYFISLAVAAFCSFVLSSYVYVCRLRIKALISSPTTNNGENTIVALSLWRSFGPVAIGVTSAVASIVTAFCIFRNGGIWYAVAVLSLIVASVCVSMFVLLHFCGLLRRVGDLLGLVSSSVGENSFAWAIVCVLSLIAVDAVCLFPWKATGTCCRLEGVPTVRVLMLITLSNILRSGGIIAAVVTYQNFSIIPLTCLALAFIHLLTNVLSMFSYWFGERNFESRVDDGSKSGFDGIRVNNAGLDVELEHVTTVVGEWKSATQSSKYI